MPVDPQDAVKVVEAAKNTWQFIVGGIASGAYAVWKYFNHRIHALEECVVTSRQLTEHEERGEKKFDALFKLHNETRQDILKISQAVARLEGRASERRYTDAPHNYADEA